MSNRYLIISAFVAGFAFAGCKTPGKVSEVMIDTSSQKKQTVAAPGVLPKFQASKLGDPSISGREDESGE